jgi:hypothetical protein
MDSQVMIEWFAKNGVATGIDPEALQYCSQLANEIFI